MRMSNLRVILFFVLPCILLLSCVQRGVDCTEEEKLRPINLVVVACGDRAPETITLLKSATIFTESPLLFRIFAEEELHAFFTEKLLAWPTHILKRAQFKIYPVSYPRGNQYEWKKLFKTCASQRLFLPELLTDVDSLLYVDTDVLFLRSLDDIVRHFTRFNSTQLAALAPEHEEANMGWYNRFARHPYYGKLGLNSGVMLMNLTRLRGVKFIDKIMPYYETYRYNITWGDQCLLNIYFHFYPEQLYEYDCSWNYRPDHCMYGSNCKGAEQKGSSVVHGCRRVFHNEKEPAFRALYNAMDKYNFEEDLETHLYAPIVNALEVDDVKRSYCGQSSWIFTKMLRKQLDRLAARKAEAQSATPPSPTETMVNDEL